MAPISSRSSTAPISRVHAALPSISPAVSVTFFLLVFSLLACGQGEGGGREEAGASVSDSGTLQAAGVFVPGSSEVAFQLPERDLFPEGIARDPLNGDLFLGSLRKSKIIRITEEGVVDTLVGRDELGQGGILGMKVDQDRRILWANYHQSAGQLGADPSIPFQTGIYQIDLETGRIMEKHSVEKEEENHLLNDIALASDGTVYITSYSKGTLYRIPAETRELEEWLPMPEGVYTNGIAMGPDERFLFVAGNADIYRVEIETGETVQLAIPEGEAVYYGDGLYFHQGALVMIASWRGEDGLIHYRVERILLSRQMDTIEEIQILEEDHPLFAFPTTGVFADGWFHYIATAQFDKVDESGTVAPWEEMSDIYILRVPVPEG